MTASTVIDAVRNRLGDARKERWDDATLLLYLSLCQSDICTVTHFYRKRVNLTLEADKYVYELPTDCVAVKRFEYRDKLLPVETRNNEDKGKAKYPCVLKDNLQYNEMEFKIGEDYSDLANALTNVYGVTVIAPELQDTYGVVSTVEGVFTQPEEQPIDDVLLYYVAIPPLMELDYTDPDNPILPTEELILPDRWLMAFLHFVSGMALQDDNDANNIQRGELEGTKYLRVLKQIHKLSAKDFTSNIHTKLTTSYRNT